MLFRRKLCCLNQLNSMVTCHLDAASITAWNMSLSRTLSGQETNNLKCWMDIISYMNTSIREEPFAYFNLEFFPCDVNKLQKVLWY